MSRTCSIKCRWLPALVLMYCLPGLAATVYRTVDENGVVNFSDIKPADNAPVETLVIDARAPQVSEAERQRLQDMRDTTDRMAADRMAREKHRAELRQLQAQTQTQYQYPTRYPTEYPTEYPTDNNPAYWGYSTGYSGYYNYPTRRRWNRWHNTRPVHPIAHPPLRSPAQGHSSDIRTSLPGNNYPASLIRKSYDPKVRAALRK